MMARPFATALVVLLLSASIPLTLAQAESSIEGSVNDEAGRPLAGAIITAPWSGGSANTTTRSDGTFHLAGVQATYSEVHVQHSCCTRQIRPVSMEPGETARLDVELWPQAGKPSGPSVLLRGYVTNNHVGGGIPWVVVGAGDGVDYYQTASREDGAYFLEVPKGNIQGLASRRGVAGTTFTIRVEADTKLDIPTYLGAAWVQIHVVGGGGASGRQVEPCNDPVCGPIPEKSQDGMFEYTDGGGGTTISHSGGFAMSGQRVAPGLYDLVAYGEGGAQARGQVRIMPGETWTLEVRPSEAKDDRVTLGGQVVDASTGAPLSGIAVDVRNEGRSDYAHGLRSDAQGRFTTPISPGGVTVRATPYDNDTRRLNGRVYYPDHGSLLLEGNRDDLVLRLPTRHAWDPAPVRVQGWIIDAQTKTGLAGANVLLRNEETYDWGEAVTDADGSYRFDVNASRYSIAAMYGERGWSLLALDAPGGVAWANLSLVDPTCCYSEGGWYGARTEPDYYIPGVSASGTPSSAPPTTSASSAPTLRPLTSAGSSTASAAPPLQGKGFAGYAGQPGGLGRYLPAETPPGPGPSDPSEDAVTPLPGAGLVLAVLIIAARYSRRR